MSKKSVFFLACQKMKYYNTAKLEGFRIKNNRIINLKYNTGIY